MPDAVADTHALIWYLQQDSRLSPTASKYFSDCEVDGGVIRIPAICVVEVIYLAEKGRIRAEMLQMFLHQLAQPDTVLTVVPLDLAVATALATVPRARVPDLPDRVIAATAVALGLPLITRDLRIQMAGLPTVW